MDVQPKKNIYESVATYSLSVLFIVLPIFFIPKLHIGFLSAKFGLILLCVAVALISLILHTINERKLTVPSPLYLYTLISIPVVYLISALSSKDRVTSLIGSGTDADTFFFVALGILLMVLVARLFGGKQKICILSLSLICISTCIAVFHTARFVFGAQFLSFDVFNSFTSNTVGTFNDLGIFTGLTLILLLLSLDFLSLSKKVRYGMYVSIAFLLVMTCVSNFYITENLFGLGISVSLSSILALFALIIFVHKKVSSPKGSMPYVTFAVFIITLAFTLQGQTTTYIQKNIGISPETVADIRIYPTNTIDIAKHIYTESTMSTLFGTGPNRFYTAWALYKPQEVNQTVFWDRNFNTSFGYIPTSMVTVGVLGILAWAVFLLLVLYSIYALSKVFVTLAKDPLATYSALVAIIGTLYLWFMVIAYTPGVVILTCAFFFTGLLGSLLIQEKIIPLRTMSWEKVRYWKSFTIVFLLVMSITFLVGVGYVWSNKLIASIYADKAAQALQEETPNITQAQILISKAISFSKEHLYLRIYSDLSLVRSTQLITKSGGVVSQSDITNEIADDIYKAIATAEYGAFGKGISSDYQDWIELGKVYEVASFLGATSTPTLAIQAYTQAGILNPTSPTPPFLIGHIFAYTKEKDTAISYLIKALAIKPDFADAQSLLKELQRSKVSVPSVSVEATSTTDSKNN